MNLQEIKNAILEAKLTPEDTLSLVKFMSEMRVEANWKKGLSFKPGDRCEFNFKSGKLALGRVKWVNEKTITINTDKDGEWRVPISSVRKHEVKVSETSIEEKREIMLEHMRNEG